MTIDDDARRVRDVQWEAEDIISIAIEHFIARASRGSDRAIPLDVLGLQLALLRRAANCAILQRDECGAVVTADGFAEMARESFLEASKRTPPKIAKRPRPRAVK
jgi:hypothetical protein